ncbi:hypothetical protein HWV62_35326 [Athelia sp. TMB]|nr:hypothetical protein HWV62_35326 [Athelia sp. TMB]
MSYTHKRPATVDERLQVAGAETFKKFQKRINNLDKELRNFSNATRQLGSSVGILSSVFQLRERLARILSLFRANASCLFPRKIQRQSRENHIIKPTFRAYYKKKRSKSPSLSAKPLPPSDDLGTEFPEQLGQFSVDLVSFLNFLGCKKNDFPEFKDEAVNASILDFEGDLKYWADCLGDYKTQFKFPAVQRYIHDLMGEMGDHLDNITSTIRRSGSPDYSVRSNAVNGFWFASLVFSIAAAVNSLLGLTWKQAIYRSPGHKVPWWVQIWIKRSPLAFLVCSVTCFSMGLVIFTYSSGQPSPLSDWRPYLSGLPLSGGHITTIKAANGWEIYWMMPMSDFYSSDNTRPEDGVLPFTHYPKNSSLMSSVGRLGDMNVNAFEPQGRVAMSDTSSDSDSDDSITTKVAPPISQARQRFQQAVRSVIRMQRGIAFPHGVKKTLSIGDSAEEETARKEMQLDIAHSPRVGSLMPKLRQMVPMHDLTGHQALVKHLQFSPDGQLLATSSWDRTSLIFRVGELEPHRVLAHPQGFVGQVAWSPDGKQLMTKLTRAIKIWTQDGVCKRTIERNHTVQSVTWAPDGKAFMSVEGSSVIKLDHTGKVLDTYCLHPVMLHDVAVTPDGSRLVGVGPLETSPNRLNPSTSRVEKRLIVYNMETKKVENQTPVMHDVRDITITRNGLFALISYEDKAPPQLWRIEMVKDREDPFTQVARLNLRHTFMPKMINWYFAPEKRETSTYGTEDLEPFFAIYEASK